MSKAIVSAIKTEFRQAVLATHSQYGDDAVVLHAKAWKAVARFLRDHPQSDMNMLVDLTAVDFPDREPRFEVVAHFYSLNKGHRVRLRASVGDSDGDDAAIETLTDLWASANWLERE